VWANNQADADVGPSTGRKRGNMRGARAADYAGFWKPANVLLAVIKESESAAETEVGVKAPLVSAEFAAQPLRRARLHRQRPGPSGH
jgi:hypothetical protein